MEVLRRVFLQAHVDDVFQGNRGEPFSRRLRVFENELGQVEHAVAHLELPAADE